MVVGGQLDQYLDFYFYKINGVYDIELLILLFGYFGIFVVIFFDDLLGYWEYVNGEEVIVFIW